MLAPSSYKDILAGLIILALVAAGGAWAISLSVAADNWSLAFLSWLATAGGFNGVSYLLIRRIIAPDEPAPAAAVLQAA